MLMVTAGCSPVVVVQPQEVGVIFNRFTGNLGDPLMPGAHLINPLADEVTIYRTSQQQLTLADSDGADVLFADGKEAALDVTVLYSINSEQVNLVHSRWQNRYTEDFVVPLLRGVVRDIASRYTAEQVSADWGAGLEKDIQIRLSDEMAHEGLIVQYFLIRDITSSDEEFNASMEQRRIATQIAGQRAIATQNAMRTATAEAVTPTPKP